MRYKWNMVIDGSFRYMMLSGKKPRLPSVAASSVKHRPSIDRFWSNGATEKACMIYGKEAILDKINISSVTERHRDTEHESSASRQNVDEATE